MMIDSIIAIQETPIPALHGENCPKVIGASYIGCSISDNYRHPVCSLLILKIKGGWWRVGSNEKLLLGLYEFQGNGTICSPLSCSIMTESATTVIFLALLTSAGAVAFRTYPPQKQPSCEPPCQGQAFRIFSKANPAFSVTGLPNGVVVMALTNASNPFQQWTMDLSWADRFMDAAGYKAFTLVNNATGMLLQHGILDGEMVSCTKNNDISMETLWTRSLNLGDNFHTIRACHNVNLNLDVDHGNRKHGGIRHGSKLIVFKWNKQDNQFWKMNMSHI